MDNIIDNISIKASIYFNKIFKLADSWGLLEKFQEFIILRKTY